MYWTKKAFVKNLLLDQIRFENNNENKLIISIRGPQDGTALVPAVQEESEDEDFQD